MSVGGRAGLIRRKGSSVGDGALSSCVQGFTQQKRVGCCSILVPQGSYPPIPRPRSGCNLYSIMGLLHFGRPSIKHQNVYLFLFGMAQTTRESNQHSHSDLPHNHSDVILLIVGTANFPARRRRLYEPWSVLLLYFL